MKYFHLSLININKLKKIKIEKVFYILSEWAQYVRKLVKQKRYPLSGCVRSQQESLTEFGLWN